MIPYLVSRSSAQWLQWPPFLLDISTLNLFFQAELCLINLWISRAHHRSTYSALRYFWRNKTPFLIQFFILKYILTLSLFSLWSSGPWLFSVLPITDSLWASPLFLPRWEFNVGHFRYMSTFTLQFSSLSSFRSICLCNSWNSLLSCLP